MKLIDLKVLLFKVKYVTLLCFTLLASILANTGAYATELNTLFKDVDSLGSRAVAAAEGNRLPDGTWQDFVNGHPDPGNSRFNKGFCSYNRADRGMSLDAANDWCRNSLNSFINSASKELQNFNEKHKTKIALNYADLYNQAPRAAYSFIEKLNQILQKDANLNIDDAILKARILSFEKNGELSAKGLEKICRSYSFYTNKLQNYIDGSYDWKYNCIGLDQGRRSEAINDVINLYGNKITQDNEESETLTPHRGSGRHNNTETKLIANESKKDFTIKYVFPLDGMVYDSRPSSIPGDIRPLGCNPRVQKCREHQGADYGARNGGYLGAGVRSITDGVVSAVNPYSRVGGILEIKAPNGESFRYVHMDRDSIKRWNVGDSVKQGEFIAKVGYEDRNWGSAAHAHIEHWFADGTLNKNVHKMLTNEAIGWLEKDNHIAKFKAKSESIAKVDLNNTPTIKLIPHSFVASKPESNVEVNLDNQITEKTGLSDKQSVIELNKPKTEPTPPKEPEMYPIASFYW